MPEEIAPTGGIDGQWESTGAVAPINPAMFVIFGPRSGMRVLSPCPSGREAPISAKTADDVRTDQHRNVMVLGNQ